LPPLYLIADRATCGERALEAVLKEALEGGVRLVQLREKEMGRDDLLRQAEVVRAMTASAGALFLVNSDVEVAFSVGADGVHLPSSRISRAGNVKAKLPKGVVGASVHNVDEVEAAERAGVDFVAFAPVYTPGSKAYTGALAGISGLEVAVGATKLPVYALGGITPGRVAECLEAGAAGVAAMSGILRAEDVKRAAEEYVREWEGKQR